MRLIFSDKAWAEYLEWQSDTRMLKRVNAVIKDVQRNPFSGIGKPEQLKRNLSGYWSRRLTDEHRLVYRVEGDCILLAQMKYHYGND